MTECVNCGETTIKRPIWSTILWPERLSILCSACEASFQKLQAPGCPICMKQTESEVCADCRFWQASSSYDVLEKNVSLYAYNAAMQDYIARWKYRGDYVLGQAFEADFKKLYQRHFREGDYVAVPIPLSQERLSERGFNQADELTNFSGASLQAVLGRQHGEKQSKRSRVDRLTAENPFHLLTEPPKYAVLIDDIYTTGATLRHAARLLKENGTVHVAACTLIRG